ncbi:hypothetical protein [Paramagnetospirillum marisnigri]|uniref:hypothetical protein n=1 Tax=Paramagnetospirillum marisnigri TaxID=1285242 RepID=UPI000A451393|nr:hypothetical protein [Paramagnetospirillum marisnigri]
MPDWLNAILDAPGNYIREQAAKGAGETIDSYLPLAVIGGAVLVFAVFIASR